MCSASSPARIGSVTSWLTFAVFLVLWTVPPALAQLTVGDAHSTGFIGRGVDAAHDPVRNVFLVVNASYGPVNGIYVNASGVPQGGAFSISGGGYSNFARVRYSPHVNGGNGGFLVVWSSEEGGGVVVRARVVAAGGGAIGAEHVIGGNAWLESAPALAYSPTSQKFLVAWGGIPRLKAALVNLDGSPSGPIVELSTTYGRDPGVTWNSNRNEFGVSFNGETDTSVYSVLAVLPATNIAAFRRTTFNAIVGGRSFITDVDFDPVAGRYVMVWCDGLNARAAEFDQLGELLGSDVVDFWSCAADSLGVAFNPVSQTFLVAGIDPRNDLLKGMELRGRARQSTETAGFRALYPRATASQTSAGWLASMTAPPDGQPGWLVRSARVQTGTTSAPPVSTPPPPPPPPPLPPPTIPTGCADIVWPGSDWVCNPATGSWLPPDTATGNRHWRMFWQNRANGYLSAWNMSGAAMTSGVAVTPFQISDTKWHIVGTGDFNQDGHSDLVWQHQGTRLTTVWLMHGTSFVRAGILSHNTVSDKNWALRIVADMNNDGHSDLVWQHETAGWVAVWFMNGLNLVQDRLFSPGRVADTNWRIVAAGDFNRDTKTDLLWHNVKTGVVTSWLMNGATQIGTGVFTSNMARDTRWRISAAVDIDGNGTADFIWRHSTGALAVTLLDGVTVIGERLLSPASVGPGWEIVGGR